MSLIRTQSIPQWIGSPDSPLFSWLDVPDDGLVVGAAVLCPTMGLEGEYSARALRDLAERLAASRWAALRVDYVGTGDSAGTWTDADLVAAWLGSVRQAIEHVRSLGAERIAVVGLRIGATLAAVELAQGGGVDDLVLWDPCVTGRSFLREERALWVFLRDRALEWGILPEGETWGSSAPGEAGSVESPGAMYSAQTVSDMETLAITPSLATRELLLARVGRKLPSALSKSRSLPHVEFAEIAGQEPLLDVDAITPDATLERIVSWLAVPETPLVRIDRSDRRETTTIAMPDGPAVRERPLAIGPARLFGMVTEPEHEIDPSAPTVILLNTGRIGHHGPARMWVDLARSWAGEGLRCVRVDLSGIGDSPTRPGRTENVEFPADAHEDLGDIRRAVTRELGAQDVVLVGLCSGGYHAVESALATPPAAICAINPALIIYPWLEHPYRRFEPALDEGLMDREAFGSTRPSVSRALAKLRPMRDKVQRIPGGWWMVKRFLVTSSPARTFERLTHAGVDVLFVVGDHEALHLCRGEHGRYRALVRGGRFRLEIVHNLEHTLLERTGREQVRDLLQEQVRRSVTDLEGRAQLV